MCDYATFHLNEDNMKIDMKKVMGVLTFVAKIAAFLSLTMSVVIKTRVLLGISNKIKNVEDEDNEDKS
jgi:hypothetical protein